MPGGKDQKPPEETSRMSDMSESTRRRHKYSFLVTATLRKHRDTLRIISSCGNRGAKDR